MNQDIALALSTKCETVGQWRKRFAAQRLAGIEKDAPRPGNRPVARLQQVVEILRKTTQEKPKNAKH